MAIIIGTHAIIIKQEFRLVAHAHTRTQHQYLIVKYFKPSNCFPCTSKTKTTLKPYLHLRPTRWGYLGVIHLDLSLGHIIETLVNNPHTLPHFLHTTEVSARKNSTMLGGKIEGRLLVPVAFLGNAVEGRMRAF